MELVIYSPLSMRYGGGFENSFLTMMPHLKGLGIHCTIFCTDFLAGEHQRITTDELSKRLFLTDTTYIEMQQFTVHNVPVPSPAGIAALARMVRKADVLYWNNAYALQDFLGFGLSKVGTPVISGYHAPLFSADFSHNQYVKHVTLPLARLFDATHVLNKDDASLLRKWKAERIYIISPGVDTTRFQPGGSKDCGVFKVLFVGRLIEQKGVSILIDVINRVQAGPYRDRIEFAIAGSGPLESFLIDATSKLQTVHVLGYVDSSLLPRLYASSDVLIMPSLRETFGNVALEAQASGLPVVAFSISGPKDIVRHDVDGVLMPRIDANSLFDGLEKIFLKWKDCRSEFVLMREAARLNALHFDSARVAERFAEMVIDVSRLES